MGLLPKLRREPNEPVIQDNSSNDVEFNKQEDGPLHIFNWRVIYMGVLVSMGGFVCYPMSCHPNSVLWLTLPQIFGYDTGQISGFLEMPDFLKRFADSTDPDTGAPKFSNGRSGTIVGLVSNTNPIYHPE